MGVEPRAGRISRMKRPLLLVPCLAAALACGEKPAPPPSPAPATPPAPGFLRPLTSRDGPAPAGGMGSLPASGSLPPGHPPLSGGATGPAAGPADPSQSVSGRVLLGPALGQKPRPTDALFLVARDPQKKIVAVRREDGVAFPFAFTLSAADAMTEGTAFAGPFEITARLSRSGDATPAAGDIEGVAAGVRLGAKDATIRLDKVRQ